jgi:sucrose-6F-phosphate phosphohydrolase
MTAEILLCSDLDRTLLPNGPQPESSRARPLLHAVAQRRELTLAYVTGRHLQLLQNAIEDYQLPMPDYAIGDVGTTLYEVDENDWKLWQPWSDEIAGDWQGRDRDDLQALFDDLDPLHLQEAEKQNTFKLSYYADTDVDTADLLSRMQSRLDKEGIRASLIWSVDEMQQVGLLDVLPEHATKRHAIEFLMKHKGFARENTVCAGDSGNDLPMLTSGLPAVLVRNARKEVREQAVRQANERGIGECLYLARGGLLGMNGNYAAGVLEGLVHFLPQVANWLDGA